MSWCASCGLTLSGTVALCRHHAVVCGQDWAVANRIFCDLIHRGVVPAASVPKLIAPTTRGGEEEVA
jgi:hypothetical protein